MKEPIILSLGGSVVVQDVINVNFLRLFRQAILSSKKRLIIVVGGGKTCRSYQAAAGAVTSTSAVDLDWIGIASAQLNAQLVRSVIGTEAYEKVITNPARLTDTKKRIIIAAGWKPGASTDNHAVHLAEAYGSKTVINMTNVDYLYDKNPADNRDAQKISRCDWKTLQNIVGTEWTPGLNKPFDPIATIRASKLGIKLIIIGPNVNNLNKLLRKKDFVGSVIE